MPRNPEQVRTDLLKGLKAAKGEIVGVRLADLRSVLPSQQDVKAVVARDYPDEHLAGPLPDSVKLVTNDSGQTHKEEASRSVDVQREKLVDLLERPSEPKSQKPNPQGAAN